MTTPLENILHETLKFSLLNSGICESSSPIKTAWVVQPEDTLAYMMGGTGKITFRDTEETYCIGTRQAFLSNGGAIRRNVFEPKNGRLVIYWLHIRYEILNGLNFLSLFQFPKLFKGKPAGKIGLLIKDIIALQKLRKPSIRELVKINTKGMELLSILTDECECKNNVQEIVSRYHEHADIIAYIDDHLKGKIRVEELARRSHLSISRFHRVFKDATSCSPAEFILNRRVDKAKKILATTRQSLSDIAENTGFGNVYYFSRMFKRSTGSSPGVYRGLP